MNRIFIGYDSREDMAYRVLKYSLETHSSEPLDIRPLILDELDFPRPRDPLQSTDFTYTRFLVPHLCGFEGTALFMDCDMLALGDIAEIFHLDLRPYALRVHKHEYIPSAAIKMDGKIQTQYPRKNWSSFMLMNCARLTAWTRTAVVTRPAPWLHRFEPIPDEQIAEVPAGWNVLDRYDAQTKLIHYTDGGPWFDNYRDHPYGDVWLRAYEQYRKSPLRTQHNAPGAPERRRPTEDNDGSPLLA